MVLVEIRIWGQVKEEFSGVNVFEFKFCITEKEIEQKNSPGKRNWISVFVEDNNQAPRDGLPRLWEMWRGQEHQKPLVFYNCNWKLPPQENLLLQLSWNVADTSTARLLWPSR